MYSIFQSARKVGDYWRSFAHFGSGIVATISCRRHEGEMKTIGYSTLFDRQWYLRTYPDVEQAGADPVLHYLEYGAMERRNPGPSPGSI
jgi:hypothetical protein